VLRYGVHRTPLLHVPAEQVQCRPEVFARFVTKGKAGMGETRVPEERTRAYESRLSLRTA